MSDPDHLPPLLRYHRQRACRTVRELAQATFQSTSHVSNLEHGRRVPVLAWVQAADRYLDAGGQLVAAYRLDQATRDRQAELAGHVAATDTTAAELLAMPDAADLDSLHNRVAELAVAYLHTAPDVMFSQIRGTYEELARRLREHAYPSAEQQDLFVALGRASGVLAYATLDTGHAKSAMRHAEATHRLAMRAGHAELAAWARGTSSLVARFGKHYDLAQQLVVDGLRHSSHGSGTAGVRLLSGAAQCAANLGDLDAAVEYLAAADQARSNVGADEVAGLFTFTAAKQAYYGASSLMWIPEKTALTRAVRDAETAIEMWEGEGPDTRSLDDERLAHVYAATAYTRLGDLDAAMQAVEPVLALEGADRISWLRKRVSELADLIQATDTGTAAEEAATALQDWAIGLSLDTPTNPQVTPRNVGSGKTPPAQTTKKTPA